MTIGIPTLARAPFAQKVNINIPFGQHANLFKNSNMAPTSTTTTQWQGSLNQDGYPSGADIQVNLAGNYNNPYPNYYGHWTYSHAGLGSLNLSTGAIIYSGGASVSGLNPTAGADHGYTVFNLIFNNQSNVNIEFAYGALIGSIQDNGSGKVQLVPVNSLGFSNYNSPALYQINNITGIPPGLYLCTLNGSNFDITGLAYNSGTMSVNTGIPGIQSELIRNNPQGNYTFISGDTSAWSISNMILARTSEYTGAANGSIVWNTELVAQLRDQIKPKYLRFMDVSFVNGSLATNYTYRAKESNLFHEDSSWVPAYWIGSISNGGSDAYTCANPTASPSGAFVDGEIIQGQVITGNSGNSPTINPGGRGARPVLSSNSYGVPLVLNLGGTLTIGHTISLTMNASYLSGGTYTKSYTFASTDIATEAQAFADAVNSDTTLNAASLYSQGGNNTVTGEVLLSYNRNRIVSGSVASATFSVAVTGSGHTWTKGTMPTNAQDNAPSRGFPQQAWIANLYVSLVYSKVLDAWISIPQGITRGTSIEAQVQLANATNSNLWVNVPILYSKASVIALVQTVASLLNPTLSFIIEYANEVWNQSNQQTGVAQNIGNALGFTSVNGLVSWMNYYGLRFKIFRDAAKTAWANAGRDPTKLIGLLVDALVYLGTNGSPTQTNRLNGTLLNSSNLSYMMFGGEGGTAGLDYSSFPNRPIDDADAISVASYWDGQLVNFQFGGFNGSISTYATILQASADWASGDPARMRSALAVFHADAIAGLNTLNAYYSVVQTVISSYDTQRAGNGLAKIYRLDYEGGYESYLNGSFSGTQNSNIDSADGTSAYPLGQYFTNNLGWDATAYGASNAIVAQNLVSLYLAWKNNELYKKGVKQWLDNIQSAHPDRLAIGCWFGYTGPSVWQIFPASTSSVPQTVFNALAQYRS